MNDIKFRKYRCLYVFLINLIGFDLAGNDTIPSLSYRQMMAILYKFHPVAKIADIQIDKARADLLSSKGSFDPRLQNETADKTFDGINYYRYNHTEVVLPTWFGADIRLGIENLSGNRYDPSESIGRSNYVGISIPLAKNLLFDKRRATLQTARLLHTASIIERKTVWNTLVLDATVSYWSWVQKYQSYKILTDAVKVNEDRLRLIKTSYRLGERPAIDTIEALSQLQNFLAQQNQAWLEFQNASLDLSLYLWSDDQQPYTLPASILPSETFESFAFESIQVPDIENLVSEAMLLHPDLLLYDNKLNILGIEKKLKFQELLPAIQFKYNQLGKGYALTESVLNPVFENNYQYGLSVGLPMRFSQGRGEYQKAKLKLTETLLGKDWKKREIENKIRSYHNELTTIIDLIQIQQSNYLNLTALLKGEETRFKTGESSLFLINSRETKALEALQKLQELKGKYVKTEITLRWATGQVS